jgi:geranylgeranyl pyrophosphate synthase
VGRSVAECVAAHHAAGVMVAASRARHPVETMSILAHALKALADGEILDVLMEQAGREQEPFVAANRPAEVAEADWRRMAGGKTAALLAAACEVGAVAADAPRDLRARLARYGWSVGLAFQAQDDILDVFGDEGELGKPVGKDLHDRKRGNLVLLYAVEEDRRAGPGDLADLLSGPLGDPERLNLAIRRIAATGARERAHALAAKAVAEAQGVLAACPATAAAGLLGDLAEFVVGRGR